MYCICMDVSVYYVCAGQWAFSSRKPLLALDGMDRHENSTDQQKMCGEGEGTLVRGLTSVNDALQGVLDQASGPSQTVNTHHTEETPAH